LAFGIVTTANNINVSETLTNHRTQSTTDNDEHHLVQSTTVQTITKIVSQPRYQ